MADGFDPEAYLEAKLTNEPEPSKRSADDDDKDHRSSKRHHRSRSRSGSRRHKEHRSDRSDRGRSDRGSDRDRGDRGSDRDRGHRSSDRDRDRGDRRGRSPEDPIKALERERQKEAEDYDRDLRTVFVSQIHMKADERDVWEFFCNAGKVSDVRLIKDQKTRRSKGIGYVEMAKQEDVAKALAMSAQYLMGFPVLVQASQAEKNRAAQIAASAAQSQAQPLRLYVGSLHFNITEEDLHEVFSPFGEIEFTQIQKEGGQSKGFGFVQYKNSEDAHKAMAHLNGIELAGRAMKVGLVTQETRNVDVGGPIGELDDDGGGVTLNAQSRATLMAKLGRGDEMTFVSHHPPPPPQMVPQAPQPQGQQAPQPTHPPSPFVLLKNMFDPAQETDPEFHLDIAEDVEEECARFGRVRRVHVDRVNPQGLVYVQFDNIDGAQHAQNQLNGRWFARKMIHADFLSENAFRNVVG